MTTNADNERYSTIFRIFHVNNGVSPKFLLHFLICSFVTIDQHREQFNKVTSRNRIKRYNINTT